jgi:hypothetical protein
MSQSPTASLLPSDAPSLDHAPVDPASWPEDPDAHYDEDFQGDYDFGRYLEWREAERRHVFTGQRRRDARPAIAHRRGRAPRSACNARRRGSRRTSRRSGARGDPDSDESPGGRLAPLKLGAGR